MGVVGKGYNARRRVCGIDKAVYCCCGLIIHFICKAVDFHIIVLFFLCSRTEGGGRFPQDSMAFLSIVICSRTRGRPDKRTYIVGNAVQPPGLFFSPFFSGNLTSARPLSSRSVTLGCGALGRHAANRLHGAGKLHSPCRRYAASPSC